MTWASPEIPQVGLQGRGGQCTAVHACGLTVVHGCKEVGGVAVMDSKLACADALAARWAAAEHAASVFTPLSLPQCCRQFANGTRCPPPDQPPCSADLDACQECTTCFAPGQLPSGRPGLHEFQVGRLGY